MKKISLSQGKYAVVDDTDYEVVSKYKWCFNKYVLRHTPRVNGVQKAVYLHRFLLGAKSGQEVDHINGDKLDNRQGNLRLCTRGQNEWNKGLPINNTLGFKGVTFNKQKKKWQSYTRIGGGVRKFNGYFDNPRDAAKAYDVTAKKYHGEFARLNESLCKI